MRKPKKTQTEVFNPFSVPFVACLGGIPVPVIRAMMSKMVDADEQGKSYCLYYFKCMPIIRTAILIYRDEIVSIQSQHI